MLLVLSFSTIFFLWTGLSDARARISDLEDRFVFLQSFVALLSENITGETGLLRDQLVAWQANRMFRSVWFSSSS